MVLHLEGDGDALGQRLSCEDLFAEFLATRLHWYKLRREMNIEELEEEVGRLQDAAHFFSLLESDRSVRAQVPPATWFRVQADLVSMADQPCLWRRR